MNMMQFNNNSTISLTIYDVVQNNVIADNFERLIRKLNSFNLPNGLRFTNAGYRNNFYIPEIQEFVVVVNDKHILTNEGKFKLNKVYKDEGDFEDLARYFLKCLEVGCGLMF